MGTILSRLGQVNNYRSSQLHLPLLWGKLLWQEVSMVSHEEAWAWACEIWHVPHNVSSQVAIACDQCEFKTRHKIRHVKSIDENKETFQCDTCKKKYSRKDKLKKHTCIIPSQPVTLTCDHCEQSFKNMKFWTNKAHVPIRTVNDAKGVPTKIRCRQWKWNYHFVFNNVILWKYNLKLGLIWIFISVAFTPWMWCCTLYTSRNSSKNLSYKNRT